MENAPGDGRLRIAVISTPRSGNTWIRHLLASLFDLQHNAVGCPDDIAWSGLPERCLIQLHWHRTDTLTSLLDHHGFRVVVIARHPFDTLVSLLSWANNCPVPSQVWKEAAALKGDGGDESPLFDLHPCDPRFVAYATGPRARALLGVSPQWWQVPSSHRVRYEDLVKDTEVALAELASSIGHPPVRTIRDVVEQHSMENLRQAHAGRSLHFWQGRPGLWRTLLPPAPAHEIAEALGEFLDPFGYDHVPDATLSEDCAEANWFRLQYESLRRERAVQGPSSGRPLPAIDADLERALAATRGQLDEVLRLLYEERTAHAQTASDLAARDAQLERVHALLYESRAKLKSVRAVTPPC